MLRNHMMCVKRLSYIVLFPFLGGLFRVVMGCFVEILENLVFSIPDVKCPNS